MTPARWKKTLLEVTVGTYINPGEAKELAGFIDQLAAVQHDRDQYKGWWEQSCQHVKEALELLGVDVSVDGYVPDTWTLREQCAAAKERIAELDAAKPTEPKYYFDLRPLKAKEPQ
jgi:hypothetical protein